MKLDDKIIEKILKKGSYVTDGDIEYAKKVQSQHKGGSLIDIIYSMNILTKDLFGQAVAEFHNLEYADLNSNLPKKEDVLKIPEAKYKSLNAVVFEIDDKKKKVTVAVSDPKKKDLKTNLQAIFPKYSLKLKYALPEDIDDAKIYYHKSLDTRFEKLIKDDDAASKIIEEIFLDALVYKASDIHFEPQENEIVIRFRVDGVLYQAGKIPKENYETILNRLKIQAGLRIDEHDATQDGAIRFVSDGSIYDLRMSIVPIVTGEKVVIRVLSEYVRGYSLGDIGLSSEQSSMIMESISKPIGMVLVTGPTGSGKTTTLYSILKLLNSPEKNITTIEDPVEYKLDGINQIQVNARKDITFTKGIRSVVRQDPDIILVGEIRDRETSHLAVNAALTGHLLLSTFHANNAATAIPRLLDMAVEPFLLSSTLDIVVSQRLIRKLCENCRHSYTEKVSELKKQNEEISKYFKGKEVTLYKSEGCASCNNLGYKGRTSIFEIIKITPEIKELILSKPSAREVWELAKTQNSKSMFEDGIRKVKTGITSLEELLRVASPE